MKLLPMLVLMKPLAATPRLETAAPNRAGSRSTTASPSSTSASIATRSASSAAPWKANRRASGAVGRFFNLGTSLLNASDGRDARRLAEAADCFARCLRTAGLNDNVVADARHNLELAKLLWRRIRSGAAPPPESDPAGNDDDTNPGSKPPENNGPNDSTTDRHGSGGSGSERTARVPTPAAEPKPVPTNDTPPPGSGQHTPIPEEDQLKPLPPPEARELLRQASERIQRERRALQRAGGR